MPQHKVETKAFFRRMTQTSRSCELTAGRDRRRRVSWTDKRVCLCNDRARPGPMAFHPISEDAVSRRTTLWDIRQITAGL